MKMKKFEDLEFKKLNLSSGLNGVSARMMFDNTFGVSVVSHDFSYGGRDGLYEVAVLASDGNLTYETPITNDVIGWLSENEVSEVMAKIQNL